MTAREGAVAIHDKHGHQLDLLVAIRRRDSGMDQVLDNDRSEYRQALDLAIDRLAASGREFCSDDLRAIAGDPPPSTHFNVTGAVVAAAIRGGRLKVVGFTRSARVQGHANRVCLLRGVA